jgi:hypothetical protein
MTKAPPSIKANHKAVKSRKASEIREIRMVAIRLSNVRRRLIQDNARLERLRVELFP